MDFSENWGSVKNLEGVDSGPSGRGDLKYELFYIYAETATLFFHINQGKFHNYLYVSILS